MIAHLTYGFAVVADDLKAVEHTLIMELRPPLNLIGWPNPQEPYLRTLRNVCRDEARRGADAIRLNPEKFTDSTDRFFPSIRKLHPLPCHRFDARTQGRRSRCQQRTPGPCGGRRAKAVPCTLRTVQRMKTFPPQRGER